MRTGRQVERWERALPWLWALALASVYGALSISRYLRYETSSWDLGIFTQAVAGYADLAAPVADLKGAGVNVLGDHFSPLLALLAPFYRLWPTPITLLVAQAVLVALSAAVVMRAAVAHLGRAAGIAVGVAYGLSYGLQSGVAAEFHEFAFAVPLLALSGAAYLDRDWRRCALWALPLLLVKEDLGLTVAALGVALLLSGARRWGIGLLTAGLVGFALTVGLLIPLMSPDGAYAYWDRFTGDGSGGLVGLLTAAVLPPAKIETLLVTLAVTGALALRSPFVLLAVPNLAERFLGDVPFYWCLDFHYSLPLMPVLFVALVDGVLCARAGRVRWLAAYATHVPALAVAVALVLTLVLPLPLRTLAEPATWQPAPRAAAAQQVLAAVPAGASVESDLGLLTHLVADRDVYWIGDAEPVVPDYVVIDASGWSSSPVDVATYAEQLHPGASYDTVLETGGYQLAHRVG